MARRRTERIPLTLQAVFLASNRGKDVHVPPPNRVASSVFSRIFAARRDSGGSSNRLWRHHHHHAEEQVKVEDNSTVQFTAAATISDHTSLASLCSDDDKHRTHSSSYEDMTGSFGHLSFSDGNTTSVPASQHQQQQPHGRMDRQSPQTFLNVMLRARGYERTTYHALQTGYARKPTAYQRACYDSYLISIIRNEDIDTLTSILQCGVSVNACNEHGESLVHVAAKYGADRSLRALLELGASVQVCDDLGRTPLHSACGARMLNENLVELLLRRDATLLYVADAHGALPLSLVKATQHGLWTDFLYHERDALWPRRNPFLAQMEENDADDSSAPSAALIQQAPYSVPLDDNRHTTLPFELAQLVVAGQVEPQDVPDLLLDLLLEESDYEDDEDYADELDELSDSEEPC